ncbi:MAG: hypothetical protein HKM94_10165 [Halobacteria archaeon]|nr:hypothetical protein [Halobacteria archaeon]
MNDSSATPPFSLSTGGFFYTLLLRSHIIEEGKYHTRRLILLFIGVTWLPLLILTALEGNLYNVGTGVSYLTDFNPHVRFLITAPLLLLAGQIIDPLVGAVVQHLKTSGVLPESGRAQFSNALNNLTQRRDSIWPDIIIIVIALTISMLAKPGYGETELEKVSTWLWTADGKSLSVTLAGWWYILLAAPLAQILLYRWVWRFIIWIGFLYRVSRIKLALLPTHGDLVGGLGILSNGQIAFITIFLAFGTLLSSGLAHEMLVDGSSMKEARPVIFGFIACSLLAIVAPLVLFTKQLVNAKRHGRREYGALGYRLSNAFDKKWNQEEAPMEQGKDILTAVDPSALADYNAVYETISGMHVFPMKVRTIAIMAIILFVPFAPLILIEVPFNEVLSRLLNALA